MATSLNWATDRPRPDLRDTLMKFDLQANQAGFVGLRLAPTLEVAEAFGEYPVIEPGDLLKDAPTLRNFDGTYNFVGGKVGRDNWATEEHGISERVDRREATMFNSWYNAESLAAMRCRNIILQAHNNRVISTIEALPAGQQSAVTVGWKAAGADPVADIRAAKLKLRDRIGMVTGIVLTMEHEVYEFLKDNDTIIERLKYAGYRDPERSNITTNALEDIFEVDEIIVSTAMKNTATDPNPVTFEKAWNIDNALVSVRNTGRNLRDPQFMRTFHWGADGSQIGGVIESYGDSSRRSDIVRVRMETQEKEVYQACAELLTNVSASS